MNILYSNDDAADDDDDDSDKVCYSDAKFINLVQQCVNLCDATRDAREEDMNFRGPHFRCCS